MNLFKFIVFVYIGFNSNIKTQCRSGLTSNKIEIKTQAKIE